MILANIAHSVKTLSILFSRYPRTCLRNEECLADRVGDIPTIEEQCELRGFTFDASIYAGGTVSIYIKYIYIVYPDLSILIYFIIRHIKFFYLVFI